jgi:hypothetical protein
LLLLCGDDAHHAGRPVGIPDWSWQEIDGVPWLQGANATFLCRLATEHPGGDHRILVGSIERMFGPDTPATPLLYHGGEYARLAYEETDPSHRPTDRGLLLDRLDRFTFRSFWRESYARCPSTPHPCRAAVQAYGSPLRVMSRHRRDLFVRKVSANLAAALMVDGKHLV